MGIFRITIRNTISQTESGATTDECTGVTLMAGPESAAIGAKRGFEAGDSDTR